MHQMVTARDKIQMPNLFARGNDKGGKSRFICFHVEFILIIMHKSLAHIELL